MAADLAFSDAAKAFASLLFFSTRSQWEDFLATPPNPGELAHALSGSADAWLDGNRSLAYAGLVRTVEHTKGLSNLMRESQNQSGKDWVSFRDAVVTAHGWRLQPRLVAEERHDAMVTAMDRMISEGLRKDDIKMQMSFGDEAKASLVLWREVTGPRTRAAGG